MQISDVKLTWSVEIRNFKKKMAALQNIIMSELKHRRSEIVGVKGI